MSWPGYQMDSERLQDHSNPRITVMCPYCDYQWVTFERGEFECPVCESHITGEEIIVCCEHGVPNGRGCDTCEFWESGDYHFDMARDSIGVNTF